MQIRITGAVKNGETNQHSTIQKALYPNIETRVKIVVEKFARQFSVCVLSHCFVILFGSVYFCCYHPFRLLIQQQRLNKKLRLFLSIQILKFTEIIHRNKKTKEKLRKKNTINKLPIENRLTSANFNIDNKNIIWNIKLVRAIILHSFSYIIFII